MTDTAAAEAAASQAPAVVAPRRSVAEAIAKAACLALIVLPILSDDTVRQFPTAAHKLGFLLFENWWKFFSPGDPGGFGWLKFNTIEVLILVAAAATLRLRRAERPAVVVTPELIVLGLFIAVVLLMFAVGLASGGSVEPALWQVRPYLHIGALGILVPQVFRTDADLQAAIGALVAAIVLKSLFVLAVFVTLAGGRFSGWRELVGHEDSVFFGAAFCFLLALAIYAPGSRAKLLLITAGPLLVAALVVNLRRAGYLAFGMSVLLLPLILDRRRRLAAGLLAASAGAAAAYLLAFWNNCGALGVPAAKVRSIFAATDPSDYSSNTYRAAENLNLWRMVRQHPFGTGFGKPFEKVFPIPDLSAILPNWDYDPHNTVFGLWMALGTPGFIVFLWLFATLLLSASLAIRRTDDPFLKSAAVFCATALAAALLVANLDQFIWSQRSALFIGPIVGFVAAITAAEGRSLDILAAIRTAVGRSRPDS